jgi:hypothetical protein
MTEHVAGKKEAIEVDVVVELRRKQEMRPRRIAAACRHSIQSTDCSAGVEDGLDGGVGNSAGKKHSRQLERGTRRKYDRNRQS